MIITYNQPLYQPLCIIISTIISTYDSPMVNLPLLVSTIIVCLILAAMSQLIAPPRSSVSFQANVYYPSTDQDQRQPSPRYSAETAEHINRYTNLYTNHFTNHCTNHPTHYKSLTINNDIGKSLTINRKPLTKTIMILSNWLTIIITNH